MHIILVLSMLEPEIARLKPAWVESERCSFSGDWMCMCMCWGCSSVDRAQL